MSEENKNDQPNASKESKGSNDGWGMVFNIGFVLTLMYLVAEDPWTIKYGGYYFVSNFVIDMFFSAIWPLYWGLLHWIL